MASSCNPVGKGDVFEAAVQALQHASVLAVIVFPFGVIAYGKNVFPEITPHREWNFADAFGADEEAGFFRSFLLVF